MLTTEEKIKILIQLRNGYPISHEWEQDYPYDKKLMLQTDKFIKELENEGDNMTKENEFSKTFE